LPEEDFVLASPVAGWGAKQWPLENYSRLAERLRRECGMPLVLDAPYALNAPGTQPHVSTLAGLIYATRRATAVVGLDSGPLHLAAALGKQGMAIYGPTDPARHGPYGGTIGVLRSSNAATTYQRTSEPDPSMREITPDQVFEALVPMLSAGSARAAHKDR
jgi:heptosyltransferase-1